MHIWRGRLVYDAGRHSLPICVSLRLSRRRTIWNAISDLASGARITEGDLAHSETIESPVLPNSYPDDASLAGRRLRKAVSKGEAVRIRDLEPVYSVERGSSVKAQVDVGGARIEVPAVAETRANAGQRVVLRNAETKKPITGRVAKDGSVQVEPGRSGPGSPGGVL